MTKTEQNRVLAWRLKLLQEASAMPRNVAHACRHYGLSRRPPELWSVAMPDKPPQRTTHEL